MSDKLKLVIHETLVLIGLAIFIVICHEYLIP